VYPSESLDAKDILLTRLSEPLISVQDVSHVTFENLVFEYSRGTGLVIRGGSHVSVKGSTFRYLARRGIEINGGEHHSVLGNEFHTLGSGGVDAQGGDRRTLTPADHLIENNRFRDIARIRR